MVKTLLVVLVILAWLLPLTSPARADGPAPAAPAPRWQLLSPPNPPGPRSDLSMAYDTGRGVAVLFGGYNAGFALDDTWQWNSASQIWAQMQPAIWPAARYGAAMAYYPPTSQTILYGGQDNNVEAQGDTWAWDGTNWTQLFPVSSPSPRWQASLTYDSQRQVLVLFGGIRSAFSYADTWIFDGVTWTQEDVSGPEPRGGAALVYDTARGVSVLFGGNNPTQFFHDTWERAGDGPWVNVSPRVSPASRDRPGAAYFPRLGQMVLFGGAVPGVIYDDTWFWNGQRWRTRAFDPRPSARGGVGMVYDSVLRGVLLFGGGTAFGPTDDTWLFR